MSKKAFITPDKKPSPVTCWSQGPPQIILSSSTGTAPTAVMVHSHIVNQASSHPLIPPNTAIPPSPSTQPSAELMNELHEYLSMDDYDKYAAALFLTTKLGCKELREIGIIPVSDFRAEFQSYNNPNSPKPSPLVRSKLIQACKILNHNGNLEELRNIGYAKSDLVSFTVGEKRFTSSLASLCRVKGSYLECLFSGRHSNPMRRTESGEYFIDRSSVYFQYILDYLRYGTAVTLPNDDDQKEALASEAEYYGLPDLARAIRGPKVWTALFLSDETLKIQQEEQNLRLQLFQKTNTSFLHDSEMLIPLFDDSVRGRYQCPIRYCPGIDDDVEIIMGPKRCKAVDGQAVTVDSIGIFTLNFNLKHANVLQRIGPILREEPLVIAGGSVLAAVLVPTLIEDLNASKDIDLFICTTDKAEAARITERVWKALAVDQERWAIVRSPGVINMHSWGAQWGGITETVQVVLRLYNSPTEVLFGFDCDSCCCAYNGTDVLLTPRCYLAIKRLVNIVNPIHAWPNRPSYELRLAKYSQRGFSVAVPGLDRTRVDHAIYTQEFSTLQGLARLLRVAFEIEREQGIIEYRPDPRHINALRRTATDDLDPARSLLMGANGFYDEAPSKVMVPSVFCNGTPAAFCWYADLGGDTDDFPPSIQIRDKAWEEIVDYSEIGADIDHVPNKLMDAWSDSSKSREFLNMKMDREDVDNMYYMGAYKSVD